MCIRDRKIPREESDRNNCRSKASQQHTVSTLHKTSRNLIVNGFAEGKPTSFTVDTGATVSIVHPDLVSNRGLKLALSCTIQTVTVSPVKVLGLSLIHI